MRELWLAKERGGGALGRRAPAAAAARLVQEPEPAPRPAACLAVPAGASSTTRRWRPGGVGAAAPLGPLREPAPQLRSDAAASKSSSPPRSSRAARCAKGGSCRPARWRREALPSPPPPTPLPPACRAAQRDAGVGRVMFVDLDVHQGKLRRCAHPARLRAWRACCRPGPLACKPLPSATCTALLAQGPQQAPRRLTGRAGRRVRARVGAGVERAGALDLRRQRDGRHLLRGPLRVHLLDALQRAGGSWPLAVPRPPPQRCEVAAWRLAPPRACCQSARARSLQPAPAPPAVLPAGAAGERPGRGAACWDRRRGVPAGE
jgi:hypothetical protein